jgi:surface carbohydrate biosynthesis protein
MKKPTIYICVEIKSREYISSIYLALTCALRGYRVYLGTHAAIYALIRTKPSRSGILLDKSTQPVERMNWTRTKIEYYCILDQELSPMLPTGVLDVALKSRVYVGSEDLFDRFFIVGKSSAKVVKDFMSKTSSSIRITGWPRVDIWKSLNAIIYFDEINKIKAKHGDFLLLIPSFGSVRNPDSTKNLKNPDPIDVNELNDYEFVSLQHENFKRLIQLVKSWEKSALSPKILIKPHPSEPASVWKAATKGMRRISVVSNGDLSPWIVASSGVIHNGSTGAIEAYYAKKPLLILKELTVPYLLPIASGISEYDLGTQSSQGILNFWESHNSDFNPSVLNDAILTPSEGAVAELVKCFDELESTMSETHQRAMIILSQIRLKSFRRALGLIRDEIYWKFGWSNINSQYNFVPRGLDRKKIKLVKKIKPDFKRVQSRRMTINLWEFEI